MATLRHHIYTIKEKLGELSDDQLLTNRYLKHLLNIKREYLLEQKYSDYRRTLPEAIKQTIEFEIERVKRVPGLSDEYILVSVKQLPLLTDLYRIVNSTILSGRDFKESYMNFVPYDRFLYVGKDKWLKTQVYGALRDKKLYLKSGNFNERGITVLNMTGVFSDPEEAYELSISYSPTVSFYDIQYPLTNKLADTAISMICEDLLKTHQLKEDVRNNASPD